MASKTCNKCNVEKPLDEFHRHPATKDRRQPTCKVCHNQYASDRYKNGQSNWREHHYRRLYGLTIADFDRMLAQQGGKCAICGTDQPGSKGRFSIDHDHTTKAIRSLLCESCNKGLGMFRDNPQLLVTAAKYLRAFQRN